MALIMISEWGLPFCTLKVIVKKNRKMQLLKGLAIFI
jgi:hypothetical protein